MLLIIFLVGNVPNLVSIMFMLEENCKKNRNYQSIQCKIKPDFMPHFVAGRVCKILRYKPATYRAS